MVIGLLFMWASNITSLFKMDLVHKVEILFRFISFFGQETNMWHIEINILPNEIIPQLGLEFETEDVAYDFYNSYAYRVGFSVRKSFREKDKRSTSANNPRAQSKFGCLTRTKVDCRSIGKFHIVQFIAEHKHETSSPSKTHLHRSHRKITPFLAAEMT
ncbi:hypothetical protein Lal_00018819 [Lupinus albus]|nr:hypothetical protein Lal_00018819 [Lupinus albus]